MATGMLKFSPNNTVFIDLDLENHTANKAVDIDAEGVEWPLCGGSSDYSTATVTVIGIKNDKVYGGIISDGELVASKDANGTHEFAVLLYKGEGQLVTNGIFTMADGDVEIKEAELNTLIVTGDGSVYITGLQ